MLHPAQDVRRRASASWSSRGVAAWHTGCWTHGSVRHLLFGLFFVLHGAAHAFGGIRWEDVQRRPVVGTSTTSALLGTFLFALTSTGFVQVGLGVWGIAGLRTIWRPLSRVCIVASLLLLLLYIVPSLRLTVGICLDIIALLLADQLLLDGGERQRTVS